jgi:hypothetical protein
VQVTRQVFQTFALTFAQQHIGGANTAVLLLGRVKCQHRVKLRQPVRHTAFQQARLRLAIAAHAMGDQSAAHIVLLAVLHKLEQGAPRLLHRVVMQIETRLYGVFAQTQIAQHPVLNPGALIVQLRQRLHRLHKFTGQGIAVGPHLGGGGLAPLAQGGRCRRRHFQLDPGLEFDRFYIAAQQLLKIQIVVTHCASPGGFIHAVVLFIGPETTAAP